MPADQHTEPCLARYSVSDVLCIAYGLCIVSYCYHMKVTVVEFAKKLLLFLKRSICSSLAAWCCHVVSSDRVNSRQ